MRSFAVFVNAEKDESTTVFGLGPNLNLFNSTEIFISVKRY